MIKNQDFVLLFEEKVVYLQTEKLGRAQKALINGVRTRVHS